MKVQVQWAVAFKGSVLAPTVSSDKSQAQRYLDAAKAAHGANPDNYALVQKERCPGCACMEFLINGCICRDCLRERVRMFDEASQPKSWQQQLANMENPEL